MHSNRLQSILKPVPTPNCLGDWASEHDMAEGGQLLLAGSTLAEVSLWMCLIKPPTKSLPCSRRHVQGS